MVDLKSTYSATVAVPALVVCMFDGTTPENRVGTYTVVARSEKSAAEAVQTLRAFAKSILDATQP